MHAYLYSCRPVQDLTVEDRVSRTQFQYAGRLRREGTRILGPRLMEKLKSISELRDVASDQQNNGCSAVLTIDRDTGFASWNSPRGYRQHLGMTLMASAWYRPFFTQLNQYHVVLEVDPQFPAESARSQNI